MTLGIKKITGSYDNYRFAVNSLVVEQLALAGCSAAI